MFIPGSHHVKAEEKRCEENEGREENEPPDQNQRSSKDQRPRCALQRICDRPGDNEPQGYANDPPRHVARITRIDLRTPLAHGLSAGRDTARVDERQQRLRLTRRGPVRRATDRCRAPPPRVDAELGRLLRPR